MPMDREKHEELLNELLGAELEHSRRTEILQELRADYSTVLSDFDNLTSTNTKLQKDNDDLIVSNSKLFREIGVVGKPEEKEQRKQEYSETISIEELERSAQ